MGKARRGGRRPLSPRGSRSGQRLDVALVERGLAASRGRAQALIMAGEVLVADEPVDKPGTRIAPDAPIRLRNPDHRYVSRGGLKLEGALAAFGLTVTGLRCLDVGASTGGFTDCLLQAGAARVVALDVGRNQLAWRLRSDERVLSLEQTDIRQLQPAQRGAPFPLITIDASFISLHLVLPAAIAHLAEEGSVVALVKPQFEVGREGLGSGGLVRDPALAEAALERIIERAEGLGLRVEGRAASQLKGARSGNQEWFLLLSR